MGKFIFWSIIAFVACILSYIVFEVVNSYKPFTNYNKIKYNAYDTCKNKNTVRPIIFNYVESDDICECVAIAAANIADKLNVTSQVAQDIETKNLSTRYYYILNGANTACSIQKALSK